MSYKVGIFSELADDGISGCRHRLTKMRSSWGNLWAAQSALVGLVQKLLTIWCSHSKYMVCHKDREMCAYQCIIKGFWGHLYAAQCALTGC